MFKIIFTVLSVAFIALISNSIFADHSMTGSSSDQNAEKMQQDVQQLKTDKEKLTEDMKNIQEDRKNMMHQREKEKHAMGTNQQMNNDMNKSTTEDATSTTSTNH